MEHTNKIAIALLKNEFSDYPENAWHYDREYKMLVTAISMSKESISTKISQANDWDVPNEKIQSLMKEFMPNLITKSDWTKKEWMFLEMMWEQGANVIKNHIKQHYYVPGEVKDGFIIYLNQREAYLEERISLPSISDSERRKRNIELAEVQKIRFKYKALNKDQKHLLEKKIREKALKYWNEIYNNRTGNINEDDILGWIIEFALSIIANKNELWR